MTGPRVPAGVLRDFASAVLAGAGAGPDAAALCAEVLVAADVAGNDTHGIVRLRQYAEALLGGRVSGTARPRVLAARGPVTTVDAGNALGPVGLSFATDLAIAAARRDGAALVAVRGSNHAGGMSWYTERAAAAGMAAVVLTGSTKPMVAPAGGAAPFLGTNAVAYAVPGRSDALSFDAAMSVVSRSRLEAFDRAGEPLLPGWATGPDGQPALDPAEVIDGIDRLTGHSLLPVGGAEHGGHKGFGIGLLVELLCGPLAGARWGRTIAGQGEANVGHFVLCVELGALGPEQEVAGAVDAFCAQLRAVPPAPGAGTVRVPGDRRRACAAGRERDGVPLPDEAIAELDRAASLTGIAPIPLLGREPAADR